MATRINDLSWPSAWKDNPFRLRLLLSIGLLSVVLVVLFFVLAFAEKRSGIVIERGWMDGIASAENFSLFIFSFTYLVIVAGIFVCFRKPVTTLLLIRAYLVLQFFRCITLLLVPLDPPKGIIPLSDPFLQSTFYSGRANLKDLFFSGHVATMLLFAFLLPQKYLRLLIFAVAFVVAVLMIIQRVHYISDIAAAPFFAFASAYLARRWTSSGASRITSSSSQSST